MGNCVSIPGISHLHMPHIFGVILTDHNPVPFVFVVVKLLNRVRLCNPRYCSTPSSSVLQPSPEVCSNSCLLSQGCYLIISSSATPFSSCLQSFPASGSFTKSQFFASDGQIIGVSALASILPMSIQDWFTLGWTGWISLQFKDSH